MKLTIKSVAVISAVLIVFAGCSKKEGPEEEKIRITIERPEVPAGKEEARPVEKPKDKPPAEPPSKPAEKPENEDEVKPKPHPEDEKTAINPEKPIERPKGERLDFRTVAENLSIDFRTKREIKEYWADVRGKTVKWHGKIFRVKTGRRGFKILVENPAMKSKEGFNIVIVGRGQDNKTSSLKAGENVRFTGNIVKFDYGKGGLSPMVVLDEVKIH